MRDRETWEAFPAPGYFGRTSSADEREQEFYRYLFHNAEYIAAVHAAGDLMWWEQGSDKRGPMVEQLGLPVDVTDIDLRRALFDRRYVAGSVAPTFSSAPRSWNYPAGNHRV